MRVELAAQKSKMGNYINANLTKEEHVVYEAHYHWSIWIGSLIGASFFFVPMLNLLIEANNQDMSPAPITWVLMIIGFLILFFTYLKVVTDEFAITNQRLIIKTGVISRDTLELNLTKVETISVSQGLFGRLFGSGTISVRGTGSTLSTISCIAEPFEFRRIFQQTIGRDIPSQINDGYYSKPEVAANPVVKSTPTDTASSLSDKTAMLYKLKELLDAGILSQEEFEAEKKKILNK